MNTSKVAVVANVALGKIASIIGYINGPIALMMIIVPIFDSTPDAATVMISGVVWLAISVFFIIKGSQIKRRIKRFKRYVSLISTQQMTLIENLAASTSQSIDFVRNDLQKMIDKKFFANATIDMAANEIIIGGRTVSSPSPVSAQSQATRQSELEMFTCAGCGAAGTKSKGVPVSCDYCGAMTK